MTDALDIRSGTDRGKWVLLATVLGSGIAFLDGTVVNSALPAIADDFDAGLSSLQWVLTAYLLTLGSLLVVGGSLGDQHGRRLLFQIGLVGFAVASAVCAVAPSVGVLIAARAGQGVASAALVPGSLAIISASFHPDDRGRAIGAWSGLSGVTTAIGPFVGGWLIDSVSWRAVFLINLPLAGLAFWITANHVPESRDADAARSLDWRGAATLTIGLGATVYALIEGPQGEVRAGEVAIGLLGLTLLAAFVVIEARSRAPMVPLSLFASGQFSGANAVTFAVYAALGVSTFLVVVRLQTDLGYSALEAGAALLPITILMLLFSARAGALAQRVGPRLPMTVGPLLVAVGLGLLATIDPGAGYASGVLPGMLVFGVGLTITVAPLTATVLGAVADRHAGVGSAVNNAVARIASLLAIAVVPALAGLSSGEASDGGLGDRYADAVLIAAFLAALGGAIAWATIRQAASVRNVPQPPVTAQNACQAACLLRPAEPAGGGRDPSTDR